MKAHITTTKHHARPFERNKRGEIVNDNLFIILAFHGHTVGGRDCVYRMGDMHT